MGSKESESHKRAMIGSHIWWRRPALRTDEEEDKERRATWLELFYDLIFVAVIAQLSHRLSADMSLKGALGYAFLFVPVWLLWLSSTYYNERFEVNDVRHRVFTFLKMVPIVTLAYSIHDAFGETSVIFAVSYIAARIIHVYMWLSAGERQDVLAREMTRRLTVGSLISVSFWIISLFIHGQLRFVLWGIGLIIELVSPATTMRIQSQMTKLSFSHISERFGLFTLIAIAETVIGVVAGLAKVYHITFHNGLAGVLGLTLAFAIWWVYFDHITYRPFRHNTWVIMAWSTLHLPLTIGITAIGAGVVSIISYEGGAMETSVRLLLCSAFSFFVFVTGIIGTLNEKHSYSEDVQFKENLNLQLFLPKFIIAAIILVIGFFGKSLNPLVLLSILVLAMVIQAVQSLYLWVKAQMPRKE